MPVFSRLVPWGPSPSWGTVTLTVVIAALGLLSANVVSTVTKYLLRRHLYHGLPRRHDTSIPSIRISFEERGVERTVEQLWDETTQGFAPIADFGYTFGGNHGVVLTDPEDFKVILTDEDKFVKDLRWKVVAQFLGDGLITSEGALWRHRRKVLTPAFHFGFLKNLVPTMTDLTARFISRLEDLGPEKTLDPYEQFSQVTLAVIIESSLRSDLVPVQSAASAFHDVTNAFAVYLAGSLLFGPLATYLPFVDRLIAKKFVLRRLLSSALAKRREQLRASAVENGGSGGDGGQREFKDFFSLLIASGELSDDEILDEGISFFFAAHDTSSSGLSWILYFLCLHPEYQVRIQEELAAKEFDLATLTAEKLEEFTLLKQVFQETLRMRPPLPFLCRLTTEETIFKDHSIPAGTVLFMMVQATHHDPKYWDEPQRFNPERFSKDSEEAASRHPFAYLPFSAGPHSCIGKRFAMQEVRILLGAVLSRFNVKGETAGVTIDKRVLAKPRNFRVKFVPRQGESTK